MSNLNQQRPPSNSSSSSSKGQPSPFSSPDAVAVSDGGGDGGIGRGVAGSGATRLSFYSSPSDSSPPPQQQVLPEIVELNVGGMKFTASRSTLTMFPGTYLEAMFGGRWNDGTFPAAQLDEDGRHYIDRDGRHFRHILNYLRSGTVISLPKGDEEKLELAAEADFYGLDGLVKEIRAPRVDVSEHLGPETRSLRALEKRLRDAYCAGGGNAPSPNPFAGLHRLFSEDEHDLGTVPLRYDPAIRVRDASSLFLAELRKEREGLGDRPPVTAATIEEFKTNFNREWANVLPRLNEVLLEEPVIVAGGAVLKALTASDGIRTSGDWWGLKASDIDLFVHCRDREEANRIARRIFYALAIDNEKWVVVRSRGVVNMHRWVHGVELKVQLVLRLYDSPAEVLIGFDVDCCACAYDGRDVWLTDRCALALKSGVNVVNPLHAWPNRASYELRLAKYAARGFAISVPGVDKKRIDYESIHKSDLKDLKGLARLVKIAFEMDVAPPYWDWGRQENGRWGHTEHLRPISRISNLRGEYVNSATDDERLVDSLDLGYLDEIDKVIVPSVYVEHSRDAFGQAMAFMWMNWGNDFPASSVTRDPAWEDIVDAGEDHPEAVPRKLFDAWDSEKRSREYLNGTMDKFDLDSMYYSKAYGDGGGEEEDEEGEPLTD